MAKNEGVLELRGTIGHMTCRKTEYGNVVSMKTGPSSEQVLKDDKFDRTRRNAREFKMAVEDGAQLRYALGRALNGKGGSSLNGRMNGLLHLIAQQDPVNTLGSRRACNGDVSLLKGFDFNKQLTMAATWKLKYNHSLDAANGAFKLELPPFVAHKKKVFPKEATHFRIISGGAAVDFVRSHYDRDIKVSKLLPLRKKTPCLLCFEHQVKMKPGEVVVQVLGIEFYKLVNENEVLLKGSVLQVVEAVRLNHDLMDCKDLQKNDRIKEAERQRGNEGEESQELRVLSRESRVRGRGHRLICEDTYQSGLQFCRSSGICIIFATLLLEKESFNGPEVFRT